MECYKGSPLDDRFSLALHTPNVVTRIRRATNTELRSLRRGSISSCVQNGKQRVSESSTTTYQSELVISHITCHEKRELVHFLLHMQLVEAACSSWKYRIHHCHKRITGRNRILWRNWHYTSIRCPVQFCDSKSNLVTENQCTGRSSDQLQANRWRWQRNCIKVQTLEKQSDHFSRGFKAQKILCFRG